MGGAEFITDGEQAMQAGDAYIEEARDGYAEGLRGDSGLFGDGDVAGAGADDGDAAACRGRCGLAKRDGAGCGIVRSGWVLREEGRGSCRLNARGDDIDAIGCERGEDGEDLFGGSCRRRGPTSGRPERSERWWSTRA